NFFTIHGDVRLALPFILDDDVEPHYLLEVEAHLESCSDCRAALEREVALRETLHRAMDSVAAPERLRKRVLASIEQERRGSHPVSRAWPALAAAAVLVVFVWQGATGLDGSAEFEEVAQRHSRALPPDFIGEDANSLANYFHGKVPFAVRLPKTVKPLQVGGRVTHLYDREAVHLRYDLPDGHFSLFVYESPNQQVAEASPRSIEFRRVHGYNVARWKDAGIVYSVVSEMPVEKLAPVIDVVAR
ncbi:MAG: zf-HC2 domain-containing protein, partial [Myxococcota bacterium]